MKGFCQVEGKVDLDDDGVEDWIVFAGATNMDSRHIVYVMRGDCGHRVADITANANMTADAGRSHGLRDMTGLSGCRRDCCRSLTQYTWQFDGRSYQQTVCTGNTVCQDKAGAATCK